MAKKRVTRKQLLKEPDEFITFTGKLIRFGRQYDKELTYAVCAVFIIITAFTAMRYFSNRSENTASDLLRQAMQAYEEKRNSSDASQALVETGPDFEKILKEYGNKSAGKMAGLVFANLNYEAGNIETAIQLYEAALEDHGPGNQYRNMILSSLGYAYEKKQDIEKSISFFKEITEGDDPLVKDVALFNLGRLYEEMGDAEKSRSAFSRLVSEFEGSIYYDLASEKISG